MIKCVNATNGIRVLNDGTSRFCCLSTDTLTVESGELGSFALHTFDELRNGPKAREIREALAAGIQHPNCRRCWAIEKGGLESKRLSDNYNNEFNDTDLHIAELNLGKLCNLQCRTCGPWSSSRWLAADAKVFNFNQCEHFWVELGKVFPKLTNIQIYGGEPLLVPKQWELLRQSAEAGYSKNQCLSLNTNGTIYDEKNMEILKEFKHVYVAVSADGIGPHLEYIRYPAKWKTVEENIDRYRIAFEKYNFTFQVCVTVSNFNIFYLDEIVEYFHKKGIALNINIVNDPEPYCIKHLRQDIKELLTERFSKVTDPVLQEYLKVVDFMNSDEANIEQWEKFLKKAASMDKMFDQSGPDTFPEYYKVINDLPK